MRPFASMDSDEKLPECAPYTGRERSNGISRSGPLSSGTWNIRICKLAQRTTTRLFAGTVNSRVVTGGNGARFAARRGNGPHRTAGAEIEHFAIRRGG
jgi:hypothetical protein